MSKNNSTSISQRKITFDDDDDVIMESPSKNSNTLFEAMNNSFNSMNILESSKTTKTLLQKECTDFFCICDSDVKQKFGCKFYGPHSFLSGIPFPNKLDPYDNGGTYPPSMYLSPDYVSSVIQERLNSTYVHKK